MREAVRLLHENHPDLVVDGELQANFAVNKELINDFFPFSMLSNKSANTLIFPNLSAGNIAYKLVQRNEPTRSNWTSFIGNEKAGSRFYR